MVLRVYAQDATVDCDALFGAYECIFSEWNIAQAIRYAAGWNPLIGQYNETVRARVISIAAEGTFYEGLCDLDNDVRAAIDEAYDRGVVIIAIAGNSDEGCDSTTDCTWDENPAGVMNNGLALHPKTITVGGVCAEGTTWHCRSEINPYCEDLPNGGECCDQFYATLPGARLPVLSVCAPMDEMFSTFPDYDPNDPGTGYRSLADEGKGTSWVAPQVAGIVALMLKMNPALTPSDVRYILEATATDVVTPPAMRGYDDYTGHGLVNAEAAVIMAMKQALPADWNGDGSIGPIDPVLFIADYAAGDPMADLNLDTAQTADDMTIFLESYAGN
jgi:subtilisin family serine protease